MKGSSSVVPEEATMAEVQLQVGLLSCIRQGKAAKRNTVVMLVQGLVCAAVARGRGR